MGLDGRGGSDFSLVYSAFVRVHEIRMRCGGRVYIIGQERQTSLPPLLRQLQHCSVEKVLTPHRGQEQRFASVKNNLISCLAAIIPPHARAKTRSARDPHSDSARRGHTALHLPRRVSLRLFKNSLGFAKNTPLPVRCDSAATSSMAMNTNTNANSWSQSEPFAGMAAAIGEQDFGNLVDFDLTQFDFLKYDTNQEGAPKLPEGINLDMLASSAGQQHGLQQTHHADNTNGTIFDLNMPMAYGGQQFSMSQPPDSMTHHSMIPPTPNSVEMHGDANRYLQQMDAQSRAMMHQYHMQQRKDAVSRAHRSRASGFLSVLSSSKHRNIAMSQYFRLHTAKIPAVVQPAPAGIFECIVWIQEVRYWLVVLRSPV
jgi:hypothetical protein